MRYLAQIIGMILVSGILAACNTPTEATIRIEGYDHNFVFLPDHYNEDTKWPLILFLHGAGQATVEPTDVTFYSAVPKYAVENSADFPFVVFAPQSIPPDTWIAERIDDLLDTYIPQYSIDEDRIYVTGLSMGGFGSFLYAEDFPNRVAAIAPFAGGGLPEKACALTDVPAWVFHNSGDTIVPVTQSDDMVSAIEACGGTKVIYTRFERNGHDAWSDVYNKPEIYEWFLQHRLSDRQGQ